MDYGSSINDARIIFPGGGSQNPDITGSDKGPSIPYNSYRNLMLTMHELKIHSPPIPNISLHIICHQLPARLRQVYQEWHFFRQQQTDTEYEKCFVSTTIKKFRFFR